MASPRPEAAIKDMVQGELRKVHTMCPGKVLSYDAATQTAKVELLVKKRYKDPETDEIVYDRALIIPQCPVAFPSGGGFSITFPLQEGDAVVVLFAERSLSEWKASPNNTPQEPFDGRVFNASDAIVIPGAPSPSRPLAGNATASNAVVVKAAEVRMGDATANKALAVAEEVEAKLNSFIAAFNIHNHVTPAGPTTSLIPSVFPAPVIPVPTVGAGAFDSSVAKVTS
jgi:hypothetical protein